ncbi:putative T7SS-secreted protein [Streptomyces sp. NPDC001406]|uniref:putative T7SS-secreted protein n=1 Tax=Streptomyces sp. NPDC001406 TaxID=3364572 RepID=UPI0036C3E4A5
MTTTAGVGADPGSDTHSPYPHLGFNPAPGSTETVRALHKKLASCARVLDETHGLVAKLMDGSYWKGDAAVAFREELQGGPLALNLKNAAHSVSKAARQLTRWEAELDDFQRRAKRLNDEAKDAQVTLDMAKSQAKKAKSTPDLDQKALTQLNTATENAQADLDKIIGKAKKLAEEHREQARYRAAKIHDATRKLAPHEPGAWDKFLDWVGDNLPDVLSWTAALIGIIALFVATGGTAAAALLLTAAALSAGAVAGRLADPVVRASLWDGFRHGEFDADFWSNAVGLAADGLGTLPGLGAVVKGAPALLRGVGEAGEALTAGPRIVAAGGKTIASAREFTDLHNPVATWVVERAPRLRTTFETTETVAPWAGFATASYGLATSKVDSLDSDTAANIGTSLDGYFLGQVDVGETIDLARRVFRQ